MASDDAPSPGDDRRPAWDRLGAPGEPRVTSTRTCRSEEAFRPAPRPTWSGMLQAAMDLLSPAEAASSCAWLFSELTKIAMGQSELEYGPKDARFKDATWTATRPSGGSG